MLIVMFLRKLKCYYVDMLRFRMGYGVLTLMALVFVVGSSLFPVAIAWAALPGAGGGGPVLTFLDAAHIYIDTSSDTTTVGGVTVDVSGASGIYFDKSVVADGSDWPVSKPINAGNKPKYWFEGNNSSTCPGNNSDIEIDSYAAGGAVNGTLFLYVPNPANSKECLKIQQAVTIDDLSAGGSMGTFEITNATRAGDLYTGINIGEASSSALFYENDSSSIYEAGDDPTLKGQSSGRYVFGLKTAVGQTTYEQATDINGNCPDAIVMPANPSGIFVTADYYNNTTAGNCDNSSLDPTKYVHHYTILVLTETPQAYASSLGETAGTGGAGGGAAGTAAPPDTCPIQNWALRWLVCPLVDAIDKAVSPINAYLDKLLTIPTTTFDTSTEPGKAYFEAWGDFRDIAVSLLVIAALVMVIGESAGFDLLDAYSIRKILPRLLTGAIAMSLSWVICTFIIELANNLNNWLPDIILTPFQGLYSNGAALTPTGVLGTIENAGGVAAVTGGTIVAATAAIVYIGIPAILSLLITLFLAMLVAFITLTIRTMIIVLWLITSPLWIACYILPTTQKGFNFARDAGTSAFVAGFAMVTFIAVGQLVAIVMVTGSGPTPILAPVAIIVSYMSLGSAFRVAGGLIGSAHSAVHGAHGGAFNALKGYRRKQPKERFEKAKSGHLYKGAVGAKVNSGFQKAALTPAALRNMGVGAMLHPKKGLGNIKSQVSQLQGGAEADGAAHIAEDAEFKRYMGDDNFNWAIMETTREGAKESGYGTGRNGVIKSLMEHGYDPSAIDDSTEEGKAAKARMTSTLNETADRVMAMKHKYGDGQALLMAATEAQPGTGTGFKNTEIAHDKLANITHTGAEREAYLNEKIKDADGNLVTLNKEGRDYHIEDDLDAAGNQQMEDYTDPADGLTKQRVRKKAIVHATGAYLNAKGNDGKLKHVNGRDYHIEKDAKGNDKVIMHDATGKMYKWTNIAAGHDRGAAVNMYARARGAANQAGRIDLGGAGFGDGLVALNNLYDAAHNADHNTNLTREQRNQIIRDAQVDATTIALDSVAAGNDQAILSGGKPYSAEAVGRTLFRHLTDQHQKVQQMKKDNAPAEEIAREERILVQTAASNMGAIDSIRARSRLNATAVSNTYTGNALPGTAVPVEQGGLGRDLTALEYTAQIIDDPAFRQTRQDYGLSPGGTQGGGGVQSAAQRVVQAAKSHSDALAQLRTATDAHAANPSPENHATMVQAQDIANRAQAAAAAATQEHDNAVAQAQQAQQAQAGQPPTAPGAPGAIPT
jgi:hypothetical protein